MSSQLGGPNRNRKLSVESKKFGWRATGLEAKQVRGGPCGLERSEVGPTREYKHEHSEGRERHRVFSIEEMANAIRLWLDYGVYGEDRGFSFECCKYVELERRQIIFSRTTVRTGNVCNEGMKPRDTDTRST